MAGAKNSGKGFFNDPLNYLIIFLGIALFLLFLVTLSTMAGFGLDVFFRKLLGVQLLTTAVLFLNSIIILICIYYLNQIGFKFSKKLLVPIFFLTIIIIAELVFAYINVTYGLIIHVLSIFLALFSPFILKTSEADMAQAFILVSLLRLINVGIPLEGISIYYQFLVIYSLLMISIGVYLYSKGIGLYDIGIRSKGFILFLIFGILIGILFGFTEYTILGATKVFPTFFIASLSVFFILGLVEELIFRGVLLTSLKSVDPFSAILLSSIAFGAMHSVWIKPLEYFFTFYAGLVLAIVYYKTENLTVPVVTHTVINFVLFQVIPFKIL